VTAPTAQTLRDHLLPLLADAGWTLHPEDGDARRGGLSVVLMSGRIVVEELHREDGLVVYGAEVLGADVDSVERAVAYLRIAGGLPAAADSGWRADPPCILCGQPAVRGLRHCLSCQDVLGHTAPVVTS
jgi:hypothetical protein